MNEEELDRLSNNYVKNLSKSIRHRMRVELSMLEQHRTKEDTAMNLEEGANGITNGFKSDEE